jgi:hypothetical protein
MVSNRYKNMQDLSSTEESSKNIALSRMAVVPPKQLSKNDTASRMTAMSINYYEANQ